MEQICLNTKDIVDILQQSLNGNVSGVNLLCRKLISKTKITDPVFAHQLLSLLSNDYGLRGVSDSASPPVDNDSRQNLIHQEYPVILEYDPIWPQNLNKLLVKFLVERNHIDTLLAANLEPIKSLLFSGPPGVGKTLAARWIASQLNLPLLTLDLASVMSSFLGKTGSNIKSVINYAREFPCVLLLDEFDAIAKRRDDDSDVGELKRLVTVLLQSIDEWPASSILIAATNHANILDPAVWRRFDEIVSFGNPPKEAIVQFLINEGFDSILSEKFGVILQGASFAELRQITLAAKKISILENQQLSESMAAKVIEFIYAGKNGLETFKDKRNELIYIYYIQGVSQRKIADKLSISHTTVARIIKSFNSLEVKTNEK